MIDYIVKLRFWLRAYDSTEISAATDAEAFHLAKAAAHRMMAWTSQPEEIDIEERREGLISYIDNMSVARSELAEAIMFDGDRPLHPEARRLVQKLAALDPNVDGGQAHKLLRDLIAEARSVPTDAAVPSSGCLVQSRSSPPCVFTSRSTTRPAAICRTTSWTSQPIARPTRQSIWKPSTTFAKGSMCDDRDHHLPHDEHARRQR